MKLNHPIPQYSNYSILTIISTTLNNNPENTTLTTAIPQLKAYQQLCKAITNDKKITIEISESNTNIVPTANIEDRIHIHTQTLNKYSLHIKILH